MKNIITEYNGIRKGFTLVEVIIAVGLFSLVVGGTISVFIMCQQIWHSTSLKMQTTQDGSMAIARMIYGLGTNSGLRAAASVDIIDAHGWYYSSPYDEYPPAANSNDHGLITNYSPNGSWRITFSNSFDGVKRIDYNTIASNIVFWPDISSESSRQLICNYVSSAAASNTDDGIFVSVTVSRTDGRFTSSNQVGTFVKMRNN